MFTTVCNQHSRVVTNFISLLVIFLNVGPRDVTSQQSPGVTTTLPFSCPTRDAIDLHCPPQGPVNISCQAGFGMIIDAAGIYQGVTGSCTEAAGTTCQMDMYYPNLAAMTAQCNQQASCLYQVAWPATDPLECEGYDGVVFFQTGYRCFPVPVLVNAAACNYISPIVTSSTLSASPSPTSIISTASSVSASITPTGNCPITDSLDIHCLQSGSPTTNIVCPAGSGMVISSSGIYKTLTGTCTTAGGTTCTVDLANTFASIKALCNAQQICNYNAVIPATLPSECSFFTGILFIQTSYRCYPFPVATSLAACINPTTLSTAVVTGPTLSTSISPPMAITTSTQSPSNCPILDSINIHCLPDGPTNIVCPAGTGMVISSSGIYKALTGTCTTSGGTTCTVDLENTFASINALCNAQQICNYNTVIPATLPPECSLYTGILFIQTLYRCYPVPVPNSLIACSGIATTTIILPTATNLTSTIFSTATVVVSTKLSTVAINCPSTDSVDVHCLPDGPTNIICPAGTGMVISSAGIFKALTGTCTTSGGTTCTVDLANTFASIQALCNAQQTCNYVAVIPATLPLECSLFTGTLFIQTVYRCYPTPVSASLTACTGSTTPGIIPALITSVPLNKADTAIVPNLFSCSAAAVIDIHCLPDGPTSFGCPAGFFLAISASVIYQASMGTCSTNGGFTCIVDSTNTQASIMSECNQGQNCSYEVPTTAVVNSSEDCDGFNGAIFLQTTYQCCPGAPAEPTTTVETTPETTTPRCIRNRFSFCRIYCPPFAQPSGSFPCQLCSC